MAERKSLKGYYLTTFLIGLGFFTMGLMDPLYDTYIPIFLAKYIDSSSLIGMIMTFDNILAIFLIPITSALSDRLDTPIGRRMPFIVILLPIAALLFGLIPFAALSSLWLLVALVFLFNLSKQSVRGPVVALMPDMVPGDLRSEANGVINTMGGIATILGTVALARLMDVYISIPGHEEPVNDILAFPVASVFVVLAVVLLFIFVKERNSQVPRESGKEEKEPILRSLKVVLGEKNKSALFILISLLCWFIAYQGVLPFVGLYSVEVLGTSSGTASLAAGMVGIAYAIFAIPSGKIAHRFGRRRTIRVCLACLWRLLGVGRHKLVPDALADVGLQYSGHLHRPVLLLQPGGQHHRSPGLRWLHRPVRLPLALPLHGLLHGSGVLHDEEGRQGRARRSGKGLMDGERRAGHLFAAFSVLLWSTTFVSTKILQTTFSSLEILFIRFCIGYLVLTMMHPRPARFAGARKEFDFALAGLLGIMLYYLCENIALEHTGAANVSVLVSTAPFFITLVYKIFRWNETRITRRFLIGFAVTFSGLVMTCLPADGGFSINPLGDGIALAAAMVWAFYSFVIDRVNAGGGNIIANTRRTFLYGILFMIPLMVFDGFSVTLDEVMRPVNLFNLDFLGVGASALCFASWSGAMKRLGPLVSGCYIYIIPAVTTFFSFIILGEAITPASLAGTALVILGLFVSNR